MLVRDLQIGGFFWEVQSFSNKRQCLFHGDRVFALHEAPIDLIPQARLGRCVHLAIDILNVLDQAILIGSRAWKELEKFTVWHSHRDMQVGDIVQRVAAVVDRCGLATNVTYFLG